MVLAYIIFFLSLFGIVVLFGVKYWEGRRSRGFISPLRERADERAAQIKTLLAESKVLAAQIPPKIIQLTRRAIRAAALQTAHLARLLENKAHRLADLASHKHHFEKKETTSEFLKQVSGHTLNNGNGSNGARNVKKDISSGSGIDPRL